MKRILILFLVIPSFSFSLTIEEKKKEIIAIMRAMHKSGGGNCECPDYSASDGKSCGGRSSYSRPGGDIIFCYINDLNGYNIDALYETIKRINKQ